MSGLSQRMLARHGGLVAVICATHVFAACASAELLRISPSDDNYGRDFQRDGQFDMLGNPASEVLFVWISATIGEERAGFEFDLANVPHGAQIITAHFNASYQASGGPPGSRISWHGYAGDGVVSLDDLELSNVLANTWVITASTSHPTCGRSTRREYRSPGLASARNRRFSPLGYPVSRAGFRHCARAWN
jgi:hypothetical protein